MGKVRTLSSPCPLIHYHPKPKNFITTLHFITQSLVLSIIQKFKCKLPGIIYEIDDNFQKWIFKILNSLGYFSYFFFLIPKSLGHFIVRLPKIYIYPFWIDITCIKKLYEDYFIISKTASCTKNPPLQNNLPVFYKMT